MNDAGGKWYYFHLLVKGVDSVVMSMPLSTCWRIISLSYQSLWRPLTLLDDQVTVIWFITKEDSHLWRGKWAGWSLEEAKFFVQARFHFFNQLTNLINDQWSLPSYPFQLLPNKDDLLIKIHSRDTNIFLRTDLFWCLLLLIHFRHCLDKVEWVVERLWVDAFSGQSRRF